MSGFDILVFIMSVIAGGAGIFCYVTEQREKGGDKTLNTEKKAETEENAK